MTLGFSEVDPMQITLLQSEPLNPDTFTRVQAELYNYLLQHRGTTISLKELTQQMHCRSPQPILKRLEHLEEKGMIVTQ